MAGFDNNYSTLVAWLKIVLPLTALAILSTLFLVSQSIDPSRAIPIADVDVEEMVREQRVGKPNYSGVTKNGVAFTVTADSANPNFGDNQKMTAEHINAHIETTSGASIVIIADSGAFETKSRQADLSGGVTIETSTGYFISTDAIHSTFDLTALETGSGVEADGPLGKLTAGKMVLTQQSGQTDAGEYLLVFTNGVKVVYNPQKSSEARDE
ncbi:MAG: LPS export ABC transporter periplasmic protein LptC [Paracoccaceae bacterium]